MKTRAEAVAVVRRQLDESPVSNLNTFTSVTPLANRFKGDKLQYGRQELRELLDFIFEGPPSNDDERIPNP